MFWVAGLIRADFVAGRVPVSGKSIREGIRLDLSLEKQICQGVRTLVWLNGLRAENICQGVRSVEATPIWWSGFEMDIFQRELF